MNQIRKMINERYNKKEIELTRKFIEDVKKTRAKITTPDLRYTNEISNEFSKHARKYAKEISKLELKKYGIKKKVVISGINPELYSHVIYGSTHYDKHKAPIDINFSDYLGKVTDSKSPEQTAAGCLFLTTTIFHECYHQCQYLICRDLPQKYKNGLLDIDNDFLLPKQVFTTSMELALSDLLEVDKYYNKSDNYFKVLHERDARVTGYGKAFELTKKLYDEPHKYIYESIFPDLIKDMYVENDKITSVDGEKKNRYLINMQQLESILVASPEKMADYPALSLAFNKDGRVKSLDQIAKDFNMRREIIKNNKSLTDDVKSTKVDELKDLYSEIFLNTISTQSNESIENSIKKIGKEPIKELFMMTKNYTIKTNKEHIKAAKTERNFLEDNPQLGVDSVYIFKRRVETLYDTQSERKSILNNISKCLDIKDEKQDVEISFPNSLSKEISEDLPQEIASFQFASEFIVTELRNLRDAAKEREDNLIATREYYRNLSVQKSKERVEEKEISHGKRGRD